MATASVIIASHNKRRYLEATLACLSQQTLPPAPGVRERRTFDSHAARLPGNEPPWILAPASNNASIARETLLRLGGYDEEFAGWGVDDVELTYRLMMAGIPMLMDAAIWV